MPYIWVPKSNQNPNPNPKNSAITQPSTSNPPKINPISQPSTSNPPKINQNKRKKRNKPRKNRNKKKNKPNWINLPEDVWFLILSKIYTIHIIECVQKVCRLFRKICIQPAMFRKIDMFLPDAFMDLPYNVNKMTRYAVDRSAGELSDIYLEYLCDDETLMYIVDRSKNLKHLRIGHYIYISDEGLVEAVQKLPVLEEVEIIICKMLHTTFEAIGHACPSLKSFSLNDVGSRRYNYGGNEEAFAIAKSMPNLRRLQLIGNCMTNEGLKAILDGCPLLESLDLRACFHINLSGALKKRCDKIKHLRCPDDSTSDYSHQACTDDEGWGGLQGGEYDEYDEYYGYDSDESGILGFDPRILEFVDPEDIYPGYLDAFDDFSLFDYFGGGFPGGFEYSDSD